MSCFLLPPLKLAGDIELNHVEPKKQNRFLLYFIVSFESQQYCCPLFLEIDTIGSLQHERQF